MKVIKEDLQLEKSPELNKSTQFKATAAGIIRLIEIASKDMYKNPIPSVLTEYVQNAIDAHVVAGIRDTAIEITLPTTFEPNYKVRDFGAGMSQDEIENIYSAIGESTKKDSNDLLGAFGMGKLVFAAYGGIMNLVSFYQGMKYSYFCRIQNGEGEITSVAIEETNEPDGLMVDIPVRNNDIKTFREVARKLYSFLEPRPIIVNAGEFKYYDLLPDAVIKPDYIITKDEKEFKNISCTIGNLPFPLSDRDAGIDSELISSLGRIGLILRFGIGEVDIVSSRDSLRYSERTIKAVKLKLKSVVEDYVKMFEESIAKANTCAEVRTIINELFETGTNRIINNAKIQTIKWNGIDFKIKRMPILDLFEGIDPLIRDGKNHRHELSCAMMDIHYYGSKDLRHSKQMVRYTTQRQNPDNTPTLYLPTNFRKTLIVDLSKNSAENGYYHATAHNHICKLAFRNQDLKNLEAANPLHFSTKLKYMIENDANEAFYIITCTPYVKAEIVKFLGLKAGDYIDNMEAYVDKVVLPVKVRNVTAGNTTNTKGPRNLDKVSTVSVLRLASKFHNLAAPEYKTIWTPEEKKIDELKGVYAEVDSFRFADCKSFLRHEKQLHDDAYIVDSVMRVLRTYNNDAQPLNIYGIRRASTTLKDSSLIPLDEYITIMIAELFNSKFKDLISFIVRNADILCYFNTAYIIDSYTSYKPVHDEAHFVVGFIKDLEKGKIIEMPKALKQFYKDYKTVMAAVEKSCKELNRCFDDVIKLCNAITYLHCNFGNQLNPGLSENLKKLLNHKPQTNSVFALDLHDCTCVQELFKLYENLPCRGKRYNRSDFFNSNNLNMLNGINVLLKMNKLIETSN